MPIVFSKQQRLVFILIVFLILLNATLFSLWLHEKYRYSLQTISNPATLPELKDFAGQTLSFKDLSNYFTKLAEKKGARYAYKVLAAAPISPNIDMHLLGHVVGDILYRQEGFRGIDACTQDFRNACSHSIVVGLLLEKGEVALPQIANVCRKAPGGKGAYTMCFHGLGHGILAYTDYDMQKAVTLCEKTGTAAYHQQEYIECAGGTVMEIIGGGFHNPTLWQEQSKKYLKTSDPLSPCSSDWMPDLVKPQCYVYLTPHLFQVVGGNLGNPSPTNFEKAFRLCDAIPRNETANRTTCYGGFGKEFVVLAKNRDIRNIDKMTNDELTKVYQWCTLAKTTEATTLCVNNALGSLYWGGENNRDASIRFCSIVSNKEIKSSCFNALTANVAHFIDNPQYKETYCRDLPEQYQSDCKKQLF